jgi:sodium pump decarboxylase gamma subunit
MDKLLYGLGVMAIGLVVVFLGLIILIGLIKCLGFLKGKEKKQEVAASTAVPTPKPVQAPVEDNGAVVAAISAAIAAYTNGAPVAIKKIKRSGPNMLRVRAFRRDDAFAPEWTQKEVGSVIHRGRPNMLKVRPFTRNDAFAPDWTRGEEK